MSENLSKAELLRILIRDLESGNDPELSAVAKAAGLKVGGSKSEPQLLTDALQAGREAILAVLGDGGEGELADVAAYAGAVEFAVLIDFLNGDPMKTGESAKCVHGGAGTKKIFVDEDGRLFDSRVDYLHFRNIRVTDAVVSRQEEQDDLWKALLNEDGMPHEWASGELKGEPIGDQMLEKIREHFESTDAS